MRSRSGRKRLSHCVFGFLIAFLHLHQASTGENWGFAGLPDRCCRRGNIFHSPVASCVFLLTLSSLHKAKPPAHVAHLHSHPPLCSWLLSAWESDSKGINWQVILRALFPSGMYLLVFSSLFSANKEKYCKMGSLRIQKKKGRIKEFCKRKA